LTDAILEHRLGRVLGVGGVISTALLALGLVAFFLTPTRPASGWLLDAGLILLMATPIARVVAATLSYLANRNPLFATLAFVVLSVLMLSVWVAVRAR
jgi:uncharacterized membrane protein